MGLREGNRIGKGPQAGNQFRVAGGGGTVALYVDMLPMLSAPAGLFFKGIMI